MSYPIPFSLCKLFCSGLCLASYVGTWPINTLALNLERRLCSINNTLNDETRSVHLINMQVLWWFEWLMDKSRIGEGDFYFFMLPGKFLGFMFRRKNSESGGNNFHPTFRFPQNPKRNIWNNFSLKLDKEKYFPLQTSPWFLFTLPPKLYTLLETLKILSFYTIQFTLL